MTGPGFRVGRRRRSTAGWLAGAALVALVVAVLPQSARQQLANGLFRGSIYALIALGYTMVYGVLKLINFAHGEIFMVGAYLGCFTLKIYAGWPFLAVVLALPVAMLGCAALGVLVERVAYRPLRRATRLAALITAIGVSLLLQNLMMLLVGASPLTVPTVVPTRQIDSIYRLTGLSVSYPKGIALVAAVVLMALLRVFVARTKTGRAMRAVSEDREAALLMGVNVDRVIAITFIIGSALAGAAGVLWGMLYPKVEPLMGVVPGLKAFVAAVLGGIGDIAGAMLGGMLIGVAEVLTSAVQTSPERVTQGVVTIFMLVAFWRLGQAYLAELPHTTRGRALRAGGTLLVAVSCWITAGLVASVVAPLLSAAPHEPSLSGSTFQDAVVFSILIVILIVKPTGLMGRYAPEKV
ncbi:MAG: branched-chain amino acid ABC transporter permease [Armatimonadetes bacterium]|nr:branched-chain amino acid ABC transporter permease [Armatimonadota bacterium]